MSGRNSYIVDDFVLVESHPRVGEITKKCTTSGLKLDAVEDTMRQDKIIMESKKKLRATQDPVVAAEIVNGANEQLEAVDAPVSILEALKQFAVRNCVLINTAACEPNTPKTPNIDETLQNKSDESISMNYAPLSPEAVTESIFAAQEDIAADIKMLQDTNEALGASVAFKDCQNRKLQEELTEMKQKLQDTNEALEISHAFTECKVSKLRKDLAEMTHKAQKVEELAKDGYRIRFLEKKVSATGNENVDRFFEELEKWNLDAIKVVLGPDDAKKAKDSVDVLKNFE